MATKKPTPKKAASPSLSEGVAEYFKTTGKDAVYLHADGRFYPTEARAIMRFGEGNFEKVVNPSKK